MVRSAKLVAVATHILRTPILRNILIVCLAIFILLPTYSTFSVMPQFVDQLAVNTEDEAYRTCAHLASHFFPRSATVTKDHFTDAVISELNEVKLHFRIEKIKVFSASGEIVYSTDTADIGRFNTEDYFHTVVAQGSMYSKIVRKHGETLEHRVVGSDVDEVYVPIVRDGVFIGAFEIYYDITARKQILDALVSRSAFILYIIASSLLLSVILMLFKAGSAMLDRMHTEQKLQESNNRLEERVAEQTCELQVTQETSIEALSVLAEHHDAGTGEHLTRIQEYVVLLATWLKEHSPYAGYINSRPDYIVETELASLLHDIGKIAIPKEILLKPGKLTMEEFDLVKEHTRIAAEVLDKANKTFVKHFSKDSYLALARDIALYHHERWNGSGYPDGLKGEAIPLSARIVALADVYDALRSARPYKAPNTHKDAVQVIIGEKGQHFDPYVVEAFMAQVEKFHEISSRNNSEEKRVID